MSGSGYESSTYGGYGYGEDYGYSVQLGPARFDLSGEAARHLSGPGSTFYSTSSQGSEYLHENDDGGIFGQFYHHSGSYYTTQTSYEYTAGNTTYYYNDFFVRDENGLPFGQFYGGQPIYATTESSYQYGYSIESQGDTTGRVIKSYSYGYDDGSYRNVYSDRSSERGYGGAYIPHAGTYYRASTYYDASTGYTYGSHN